MELTEVRLKALELAGWVAETSDMNPTVAWLLTAAANIEKYILAGETWAGERPPPRIPQPPSTVNA